MERLDRISTGVIRFLTGVLIVIVCVWVVLYWRDQAASAPPAIAVPIATVWPTSACAVYRGQSSTKYDECLENEIEEQASRESERKAEMYDGSDCFPDPRGGGC